HLVMIGCDRLYMCIQRVQARFAHADTKVALTSLACTDMVSEHGIPKDHGAPSINFNQFLEKEKLKSNGSNFTDWFRHVRIVLTGGSLQYVLDAPLGPPPAPVVSEDVKNVYETRVTRYSKVQCAILCSLEAELQKRFEHHDPCEMIRELKVIFETHAAMESYEASKHVFGCMMEEGSSVSEHVFAMSGHANKLSDLGIVIPNQLGIHRVLQSLPPSYKNFVMNYNMQNMNKELPELFSMLKSAEVEIRKENQVFMVNKTTSFKKQGKPNKGNFKKGGKKVTVPPEKPKAGPKPDTVCYYCKEKGHWKRNCSKYLADLKSGLIKKKGIFDIHVIDVYLTGSRSSAWVFDTGSVAHICNSKQELRNKRSLARDEVTMRVGNGSKMDVKTAFLNGDIEEELYMVQPKGFVDPKNADKSGYVFILNGAAVSWMSSKQCTVAKSSTESEYIAASEASSEAVWMKRFIIELGVVPSALDPLVIYCDNTGAIANAREPRSHKKLRHIKLHFHSIREYIEDGGSKKRGKGHVDEIEEEVELTRPSKLTARQLAAQKNTKSPAVRGKQVHVSVKNMPYLEYKELRPGNPYLIPRNNRGIATQQSIDTAKMAATKYFDEAYAMCGKFGLYPIMELNKDFDIGLIQQFYATVHFQQDEARTFRWMTHETLLEANLASFGAALGYPRSPVVNDSGWRSHDSSFAQTKDALEPLYIKGWGITGKSADLLPTWDIMLRVYRETIGPKGGNLDELHTYEVDLMANSHAKKGTGEKLDVMDYIYNEKWSCVMEKKLPIFAPFIMNLIEDTWIATRQDPLVHSIPLNITAPEVKILRYQQHSEAKKSRARQKSIMRALNVEVSPPGSEENITPEAEWVSQHGIPLPADGLEIESPPHTPPYPGASSDLPPGWAPWDA
ncbi:hypothetical protein QYE76_066975, partial [Lolium multiflorum]